MQSKVLQCLLEELSVSSNHAATGVVSPTRPATRLQALADAAAEASQVHDSLITSDAGVCTYEKPYVVTLESADNVSVAGPGTHAVTRAASRQQQLPPQRYVINVSSCQRWGHFHQYTALQAAQSDGTSV